MSRIGKLPISIPAGVTVTLKDNVVTVKGPKGEMSQYVNPAINVAIEDGHVTLTENEKEMIDERIVSLPAILGFCPNMGIVNPNAIYSILLHNILFLIKILFSISYFIVIIIYYYY